MSDKRSPWASASLFTSDFRLLASSHLTEVFIFIVKERTEPVRESMKTDLGKGREEKQQRVMEMPAKGSIGQCSPEEQTERRILCI